MKQYAMYLRKSRADIEAEALGEMETLARHEKILTELAKRQNLNVVAKYKEIVSGESISARPEMQRLLHDLYQNKYDGVLVMEVERLARGDTKDQGTVAEAFKFTNTLIITPVKTYDPNNQYDEEYFEFGLFMSRREYKTITRRLNVGRLQSAKEGNYIGSRIPFGYDVIKPEPKTRTLIPNQYADTVRWMYDEYLSGTGMLAIAEKMNNMKIPTVTGKADWIKATVKGILTNDVYIGKIHYRKHITTRVMTNSGIRKKNVLQSPVDQIIVDGKHDAIIDENTFYSVQNKINGFVPTKPQSMINPLAGLLRCASCGRPMQYKDYNSYSGAANRYEHPKKTGCKCKSVSAQDVIDSVIKILEIEIENFDFNSDVKESPNNIALLERQLIEAEAQKDSVFDKYERGIYTDEEFIVRKRVVENRIKTIRVALSEEQNRINRIELSANRKKSFSDCIYALTNESVSISAKNQFLKSIIDKIEIHVDDKGRNRGANIQLDIFYK